MLKLCHRIINNKHVIWAVDSNDESKNFYVSGYDTSGYGDTLEDAEKDFINKIDYIKRELEAFEKSCDMGIIEIVEVE